MPREGACDASEGATGQLAMPLPLIVPNDDQRSSEIRPRGMVREIVGHGGGNLDVTENVNTRRVDRDIRTYGCE